MARLLLLLVLVAGVVGAAPPPYDLYDLINGVYGSNQIVIGDKTFTFSSATLTGFGNYNPPALAQGSFSINPEITGNLYGFTLQGGLSADAVNPPGESSFVDLGIVYTVTTPTPRMTDIHGAINGACVVTGSATCNVVMSETAKDILGNSLIGGSNLVTTLNSGPQTAYFSPSPVSFVRVTKDIILSARANEVGTTGSAFATISVIDQFISQVPEPGFYGVLACGLSGLVFALQRRRKSA